MIAIQCFRATRERLDQIWKGSEPINSVKEILIDLSCYENDDIIRQSLKLLTTIHFHDATLFSHAAHTQLLIAEESLLVSKQIQSLLPTLRHLLSIDCDVDGQRKILNILVKLAEFCSHANDEEPHVENQLMLYNYGM